MTRTKNIGLSLLLAGTFLTVFTCKAQNSGTPTNTWVMPGVSYQVSPKLRLESQLGLNEPQHSRFIFTQGFYQLDDHFSLNAGYFLYQAPVISNERYMENDGLLGISYAVNVAKFVIDDRNMLNAVYPNLIPDKYFYRNRVRVTLPFMFQSNIAKIYAFDEGYYYFKRGRLSRKQGCSGCKL